MANRVKMVFSGLAKQFFRSPGSVFWTIAFPVMLILIFGAIFSGTGVSKYDLYVQDLDDSLVSGIYIDGLEATGVLNIHEVPVNEDVDAFIERNSVVNLLIIPAGFGQALTSGSEIEVTLRQDSTAGSSRAVLAAVNAVTQQANNEVTGGREVITVRSGSIVSEDLSFIDFFLPGTIGLMVMMIAVQSIVGYQTRFRNNGIFRKLATTPMNNAEWLSGMMLWMLVMVAISVAAIMVTGMLMYDVRMSLDLMAIAMIVVATGLFTAIGMIISQFVKDEEVAGTAAGAITFPMMFLSGSFFPLESMPEYLQAFAQVLPLTYVNNGLRDAMVYGNASGAMDNLLIVLVMAVAFIVVTVAISGWKKE
ncbi:hypothetical protein AOA80_02980 [Methanomassiliicoccales archaeon RumEn M1]|nr:hypothetical protein AOA80_02980 [Methanomassiliicoccales archaeon RumEn M1]